MEFDDLLTEHLHGAGSGAPLWGLCVLVDDLVCAVSVVSCDAEWAQRSAYPWIPTEWPVAPKSAVEVALAESFAKQAMAEGVARAPERFQSLTQSMLRLRLRRLLSDEVKFCVVGSDPSDQIVQLSAAAIRQLNPPHVAEPWIAELFG